MTVKHNLRATTDPGATDDASVGYARGSGWWNDTKGVLFRCTDSTASAAVWLREGPRRPKPFSQAWLLPAHLTQLGSGTPVVSSIGVAGGGAVLSLVPFDIPEKMTVEALGLYLNTAGSTGAAALFGLYAHNPTTGKPDGGARLYQSSGTALDGTTGARSNTGLSVAVSPGLVWGAILLKDVTTMPVVQRYTGVLPSWVFSTADTDISSGNIWRYYSAEQTYAAGLPSTCPSTSASTGIMPVLRLRLA